MMAPSAAPNPMSRAEWFGAPHPETVVLKQSVPCTPCTSATIPPAAAPITAPQIAVLMTARFRADPAATACESVEPIAVMARPLMRVTANAAMRCAWRGTAKSRAHRPRNTRNVRIIKSRAHCHCVLYDGERCVAEGTTKFHDSSSGSNCAEPEALIRPGRRVWRYDVGAKIGHDTRRYLRRTGVSAWAHVA